MDMEIYGILFKENLKDKFKNETYKVDRNNLLMFKRVLDEDILNKLNTNVVYNARDLLKIFEKNIHEDDLIEFLKSRDLFKTQKKYIKMLNLLIYQYDIDIEHLDKYVMPSDLYNPVRLNVKKMFYNLDDSEDEINNSEENSEDIDEDNDLMGFVHILKNLGIISKEFNNYGLNPSFYKMFGLEEMNYIPPQSKDVRTKMDIDFTDFFPGKSNGRVVRYLKIYKAINNVDKDYTKDKFKDELIKTGLVDVKKGEIYYKKDKFDELKEWITNKIIKK